MSSQMTWSAVRLAILGGFTCAALVAVPVSFRAARNLAEPLVGQYAKLLGGAAGKGELTIEPVTRESKDRRGAELATLKAKLGQPRATAERTEALRTLRQARRDLRAAEQRVRAQLAKEAQYAGAVAAVREADGALERAGDAGGGVAERYAMAEKLLAARARVTRLEADAMKGDVDYAAARQRVRDAAMALAGMDRPANAVRIAEAGEAETTGEKKPGISPELTRVLSALRMNE